MTDLFTKVLRVHAEPCVCVDEAAVHQRLTAAPAEYLRYVGQWLTLLANGEATLELPPKWIHTDGEGPDAGDFRVMPCVVRHGPEVIKTVKLVGTNRRQREVPDQITVGKAFRLHPRENFITHVFEACLLSSARTGVCSALALSRLAPRRKRVAVVGAGRVGYYSALYAAALGGVEEIVFRDLDPDRAAATAALGGKNWSAEPMREPITCDVLVLATTAREAFCAPENVDATIVVSLGADTEDQHELSPRWTKAADVYIDSVDCLRVGDVRAWLADGAIAETELVDLLALWRDGPRKTAKPKRVFVSTGSALLDNLTIAYLLRDAAA